MMKPLKILSALLKSVLVLIVINIIGIIIALTLGFLLTKAPAVTLIVLCALAIGLFTYVFLRNGNI